MFQATSLGLGREWTSIKKAYREANRLCGDIVKVTPSSKVVGDLAQFMVANNLSEADVLEKASLLSFPTSVVEYFQGYLGQPSYGFPEPFRSQVIRNLKRIDERPGKTMPPFDFHKLKLDLEAKYPNYPLKDADLSSAALYPKVFDEYVQTFLKFGDLSVLPTRLFLAPIEVDQEVLIELEPGNSLIIKLLAVSPVSPKTGTKVIRISYFSLF